MKKLILLCLLAMSSLALAGTNHYLFMQTAKHGTLTQTGKSTYQLVLIDTPTQIAYFTDRPQRDSGLMPIEKFTQFWTNKALADNFTEVPPNVAITMKMADGKGQGFVAVFSKPTLKDNKVIYTLKKTSKKSIQTGELNETVLFFDDIPWNPGGF